MPMLGTACHPPLLQTSWVPHLSARRCIGVPKMTSTAMLSPGPPWRCPARSFALRGALALLAYPFFRQRRWRAVQRAKVQRRSADFGRAPANFDYTRSTEDFYSVPHFCGEHAEIRALLDYSWHKLYHPARVEMQDKIISHLFSQTSRQKHDLLPWVVFTAGAMGAGKGHVVRWMEQKGYLPLDRFVVVDPDQIRQSFPEWPGYLAQGAQRAGELTQKEAGCIAEILGYKALQQRLNVVFDGSLRNAEWYTKYFQLIRDQFPGIRIMILHIVAEEEQVLKLAERRARSTGRRVPREVLLKTLEIVPRSVRALAPYADFVCRIRNTIGSAPRVEREVGAPYPSESVDVSWDLIGRLWRDIDAHGDGELSKAEVDAAIAQGLLTEAVVRSLDTNGDGAISKEEFRSATVRAAHCQRQGTRPLWEDLDPLLEAEGSARQSKADI
eukprot:TRINITY_DN54492_c0_g1_i1.p1 TRINITY_DN54492_c0_g1~~TRINITY_DN54492_c0_g1_i1.p1  ORF type:complete len:441 (-),score=43.23 TRINITY_DN54492_c0_g1_i1:232-1554(-)